MKALVEQVDPREVRRKLGMNQQTFWGQLGVTQSGGSRYESGRVMPRPVSELLRLVHIEMIDIQKIRKEDLDVLEYLKASDGKEYRELKKTARAWVRSNKKDKQD